MTSSDDGYVHDPAAFDGDGETSDDEWLREPVHPEAVDREFGWRGWVLVGAIVLAFVVAPLGILLWPPSLNYWFALLILPLFPAVILALTAVWATTRP
ncbi:hypothetical protein [Natrononativus amylolyticus]|uniref:hypothetical protein n=1 Tax=Natrononativus amylolyticus TaxID=2963434 RepID=UPI0020CE57F2|nr:hypothetical protein [Natrononativus amylolyticus]